MAPNRCGVLVMVLLPGCACCGTCISLKSEGWSGRLVDEQTGLLSASGSNIGFYLNGELYGQPPAGGYPYTLSWPIYGTQQRGINIQFTESSITATISVGASSSIVLQSTDVAGFEQGAVVAVDQLISNTLPTGVDLYNKKLIDTVGRILVRRDSAATCSCGCASNFYQPSVPAQPPDTYTLVFTSVSSRPSGPRSPSPGMPSASTEPYAFGQYASFVPPASVRNEQNGTEYTFLGCDSYIPRVQSPIVLRKVAGTTRTYLSDPIHLKPCHQYRYRLDACGYSITAFSPRLTVYNATGSNTTNAIATIYGPSPPCIWNRSAYESDPTLYEQEVNSYIYTFGGFATVSPGGTYAPETLTACGSGSDTSLSLAEGCLGARCPPQSVTISITTGGNYPSLAGSYSVGESGISCGETGASGAFNYFAGSRGDYASSFSVGGGSLTFIVYRQSAGGQFPTWFMNDLCGCESRVLGLKIDFSGGGSLLFSSNAARLPSNGNCFPICSATPQEAVFNSFGVQEFSLFGSTSRTLGRVTVAW